MVYVTVEVWLCNMWKNKTIQSFFVLILIDLLFLNYWINYRTRFLDQQS